MKLLSLLTIILLSAGVQAADAKKIQRKPNSLGVEVPPDCTVENKNVADPEKVGTECARIADGLRASLMEQIEKKQLTQEQAREVFDYEVKIRLTSQAYYATSAEKVLRHVGVRN